ncbi:MAG: transposase [Pyrinomonadaceae bacterium MAG19_C2-C3]|nr:transposase [Pyrinomonadaceae bacterium MAG19_C2-C3]
MSSRLTFKYRIYPTKKQTALLESTLSYCTELYNAALQERRDAWRINRESINFAGQSAQLVEIKEVRSELNGIYSQVLQDTLHRVDKTFKAFFQRVKRKTKAGFPRFRSRVRYNSFTYPQLGFSLSGNKLSLSKIGKVKIKLHRETTGKIKTLTIKREAGRWYACLSVEGMAKPLPVSVKSIGVDVGLTAFATLSDGTEVENPRHYRIAQAKLRRAQRKVARRSIRSHRRRKAVQLLQRAHAHVRNQRSDFHHKISQWLVANYGRIAVEDLNIKGLAAGCLAREVNDAGWSAFLEHVAYKAENAGRDLVKVDPRGTSQTCLCGAHTPKTLSQRWHQCLACGLSANRDHVSAQLILFRAGIPPSSVNASH